MNDIKLLYVDDNNNLQLGFNGEEIEPLTSGSDRLMQKIIFLLKQEPNSSLLSPDGFSLRSVIQGKVDPAKVDELKLNVYLLIDKLQKAIIAEQEQYQDVEDLDGLLEKITLSNVTANSTGSSWEIEMMVFDKAGGLSYLKV